jgi:hypothetical protein
MKKVAATKMHKQLINAIKTSRGAQKSKKEQ